MGNFLADFYSVNGLVLESRKRREHLSEEDILRNKAIMESLSKGGNLIEQNYEVSSAVRSSGCRVREYGHNVNIHPTLNHIFISRTFCWGLLV